MIEPADIFAQRTKLEEYVQFMRVKVVKVPTTFRGSILLFTRSRTLGGIGSLVVHLSQFFTDVVHITDSGNLSVRHNLVQHHLLDCLHTSRNLSFVGVGKHLRNVRLLGLLQCDTPFLVTQGVVVIYCHLKLSVVQTPRFFNLTSKSYSKVNVPYTSDDDLITESGQSV